MLFFRKDCVPLCALVRNFNNKGKAGGRACCPMGSGMSAGKSETGVVRRFLKKDFSVLHTYSGKALRKYAVPGLKKYIVNFTPQQKHQKQKREGF